MLNYVRSNSAPKWKNPFFFVQEFPDPTPHNYNGQSHPDEPMVIAIYREVGGIYTRRDAELYGMKIVKPFN